MFLDEQHTKEQKPELQIIPSSSVFLQIQPEKQNEQNFNDKPIIFNSFVKYFTGALIGAIVAYAFGINPYYGAIVGLFISLTPEMLDHLKKKYQNQEESSLNINDCEKLIGLDEFKKINGRDYTKDEFNQKLNRCLLFEEPNKQPTEALKLNALKRQRNLQRAKVIIYKKNDWEE
ncbi:hypothetical protein ABPG72_016295 [Tetrahymena utriculariae]